MKLLLLLSALLAALSGAGASARTPAVQAVAVQAGVSAAPLVRAHAHVLPGAPLAAVHATPIASIARAAVLLPAPRLWASRRRE